VRSVSYWRLLRAAAKFLVAFLMRSASSPCGWVELGMSSGVPLKPNFALRIAAVCSLVFWASMILFVADEISFDRSPLPSPWWVERVADILILIFWLSACFATAACLWAAGAQRRFLARVQRRLSEAEASTRLTTLPSA
jgi:hypothetical protein